MKFLVSLCLASYLHCSSYGSELRNPFDFSRLKNLFESKTPENATQSSRSATRSKYPSDVPQYDSETGHSRYDNAQEYPQYPSKSEYGQYGSEPGYSQYGRESEYPQYASESQYPQYPSESDYSPYNTGSQYPQYASVVKKNQVTTKSQFRTDNIADVYLISQFIVLVAAESYKVAGGRNRTTPLYHLSTRIKIQKLDGNVFFWNKNTGRVIMIVEQKFMKEYMGEICTIQVQRKIDLNLVFNELLGLNFAKISCQSRLIFESLSKIFSKILGIDTVPTGLFNLYGLQIFKKDLQISIVHRSTMFPGIGSLYEISEVHILAQQIGEISVLINLAAPWNSKSILSENMNPITTASGYTIGNILGNKLLIRSIDSAIQELIDNLESEEMGEMAIHLIRKNAFDFPILNWGN